jgi:hypothetical protein
MTGIHFKTSFVFRRDVLLPVQTRLAWLACATPKFDSSAKCDGAWNC